VHQDWAWGGRYEHLYGVSTYRGRPLHGFRTSRTGAPLDRFGTLLYVDTLHSAYGRGWRRENSFVTHRPTGIWCYSLNPHGRHPAGNGRRYRITMQSPGALPDIRWQGRSLGAYDRARDRRANAQQRARFSDRLCRPS
jgi:hypothetical protein